MLFTNGIIVALVGDHEISIYDCISCRRIYQYKPPRDIISSFKCFCWEPSGQNVVDRSMSQSFAIGTADGRVLVMTNFSKSNTAHVIVHDECKDVNCLDWSHCGYLYIGGTDGLMFQWNTDKRQLMSRWKAHRSTVQSVTCWPNKDILLTADEIIKMWDLDSKTCLSTFSGHGAPILTMQICHIVPDDDNLQSYLILSVAKEDRYIYAWRHNNGNEKVTAPTAALALPNVPISLSVGPYLFDKCHCLSTDENGCLYAFMMKISRENVILEHSATTVIETAETPPSKLSILAATVTPEDGSSLTLIYGSLPYVCIERMAYNDLKPILKKEDPVRSNKMTILDTSISKIKVPVVSRKRVNFLVSDNASKELKKPKLSIGVVENPVDYHLMNTFRQIREQQMAIDDGGRISMSLLLVQGLHSHDDDMINEVMNNSDVEIIKATTQALPRLFLVSFLDQIRHRLYNERQSDNCLLWLKYILAANAQCVADIPSAKEALSAIMNLLSIRTMCLNQTLKVLDLLNEHLNGWNQNGKNVYDSNGSKNLRVIKYHSKRREEMPKLDDESNQRGLRFRDTDWTSVPFLPRWGGISKTGG